MFLPTVVFQFTAPATAAYRLDTVTNPSGLQADTVVEVRASCLEHFCLRVAGETCEQTVLACNDVSQGEMASVTNLDLEAGRRVFVLVSTARLAFNQVGVVVNQVL